MLARGIAGRACAAAMDTGEPPRAPEQAVSWAASHGGADGLVCRSGHGARRIGLVYATGVGECGMPPPAGTAGDSYGNAMAEGADGAYRTGLVRRRKPFRDSRDPESATFRRVSWRGPEASAPALGLQDTGTDRNRVLREPNGASRPTIRAEQKNRPYHPVSLLQRFKAISESVGASDGGTAKDKFFAEIDGPLDDRYVGLLTDGSNGAYGYSGVEPSEETKKAACQALAEFIY